MLENHSKPSALLNLYSAVCCMSLLSFSDNYCIDNAPENALINQIPAFTRAFALLVIPRCGDDIDIYVNIRFLYLERYGSAARMMIPPKEWPMNVIFSGIFL